MIRKKYLTSQVQRLMEISASELQLLIKENRKHINLEFIEDDDGKSLAYIDSSSLKKLIFFKHLKTGSNLTIKEACEQMKEMEPLVGKQEKVEVMFSAMEKEVKLLNEKIQTLITKYEYVVKELSETRSVNISLNRKVNLLKAREIALIEELASDNFGDKNEHFIISEQMIN